MRMAHRIAKLEGRRTAAGECPACGSDGSRRVEFEDQDDAALRTACPVCSDRGLIVVQFVRTPLPDGTVPPMGGAIPPVLTGVPGRSADVHGPDREQAVAPPRPSVPPRARL